MIRATVLTRHGYEQELHFNAMINFSKWHMYWSNNRDSARLVHGWERSIRLCDITRVISVEEEN